MAEHALTGGCPCGAVRYTLDRRPMFVHCCHCRWCQRETGSAFVLNGLIERWALTLTAGEPDRIAGCQRMHGLRSTLAFRLITHRYLPSGPVGRVG